MTYITTADKAVATVWAEIAISRAVRPGDATMVITTGDSIGIAEMVEDNEGAYITHSGVTHLPVWTTPAHVARTVRQAEAAGCVAEMRLDGKGNWTVEIGNGKGSSYGRYTFAG